MSENKTFDEKIKFWKNIVANNNKYSETIEPSKKPNVFIKQDVPKKEQGVVKPEKKSKKKTKKNVDLREFTVVDDCLQPKQKNDEPVQEPVEETSEELTRQLIEMFKEKK